MKAKFVIISGIIFFALGLWWGILKYQEEKAAGEKESAYFGTKIESFCFNQECLTKKGDNWRLNKGEKEEPADNDLAESMLKKIQELAVEEIVAENSQKFAGLGFEENNKVWLEAGGKKLLLGKITDNYNGTYVQKEGEGAVYFSGSVINRSEVTTREYWRRKWVTNLPVYQTTEVRVRMGGKERVLTPKENKWPEEALVNSAVYLKAKDFWGTKEPGKATVEIDLKAEDGKMITLKAGTAGWGKTAKYWATADGQNYFEIEVDDFRRLTAKGR